MTKKTMKYLHTLMKWKNYQVLVILEHSIEVPALKYHLAQQALEVPKKYLNRQVQNHLKLPLTTLTGKKIGKKCYTSSEFDL